MEQRSILRVEDRETDRSLMLRGHNAPRPIVPEPARRRSEDVTAATTTVRFPQVPPPVCTQNKTVAFLAVVDGRTTMMEIWAKALRDHFEAASSSPGELLEAFRRHRPTIEAMARKKLQDQTAAGWRLLTSADFEA